MAFEVNSTERRAFRAASAAIIGIVAVGACDNREPKPKVGIVIEPQLIGTALAQQTDQVVPPSAIKGAMAPIDARKPVYAPGTGR